MNQKPMDLISLEIHIHLKIRGEHTQTKYICNLGTARTLSQLAEPCSSNLHAQSVDWALHGALQGLWLRRPVCLSSHSRDWGLPVSTCAIEAMNRDSGASCLLKPQGHSVTDSENVPLCNLDIPVPDAAAGIWWEPPWPEVWFPLILHGTTAHLWWGNLLHSMLENRAVLFRTFKIDSIFSWLGS